MTNKTDTPNKEVEVTYYIAHAGPLSQYENKQEALSEYEHRLWDYGEGLHEAEPLLFKEVTTTEEYEYNHITATFEAVL